MADGDVRRPRDSQRSRVLRAVNEVFIPILGGDAKSNTRILFGRALRAAAVKKLLGGKRAVPEAALLYVEAAGHHEQITYARAMAALAAALARTEHPSDEPLHGWRYARLLLAMMGAVSKPAAAALRAAFVRHKVRHKAPRAARPASPVELERLKGLRMLHAMDKLFGEAGKTPLG